MGKGLVNRKKWTQDEFRILVVLLLTVLYPVLVSSFFTIFYFLLVPFLNSVYDAHIYWLTAALMWGVLCAMILPCFRTTQASVRSIGMDYPQGPEYPTKQHAVQPFVKVEAVDEKKRVSLLTNKSQESSESIEKGICEEKADKESLEKSKENITQSGEFLNECIGSLGSEKLQEEAECEVHAEEKKGKENIDLTDKEDKNNAAQYNNDAKKQDQSDSSSDSGDEEDPRNNTRKDDEKKTLDKYEREEAEDSPEVLEPIIEQSERETTEAAPLQVEKGKILESETLEEERVMELEEADPVVRRKPLPTIDTSRASGYYECSMPTPKSASSDRPESNMVFLFVNPDIASAEKDIIVDHQGEIEEQKQD